MSSNAALEESILITADEIILETDTKTRWSYSSSISALEPDPAHLRAILISDTTFNNGDPAGDVYHLYENHDHLIYLDLKEMILYEEI